MTKSTLNVFVLAGAMATLSACGSTPKPKTEIALSQTAVQNAELSDAQNLAPIELRKAKEKQAMAEGAASSKNFNTAKQLAEQAEVDAELARAKSEAEKSRLAVEEVDESIQMIRTELNPDDATQ